MKRIGLALGLAVLGLVLIRADGAERGDTPRATDWPVFRANSLQTGVVKDPLPNRLRVRWTLTVKDGTECTAAVAGGVVYIGAFDNTFYALDLKTGQKKWAYQAKAGFKTPPGVKDGRVYVGDEDGILYCIDTATGKAHWTYDAGAEITSGVGFAGDNILFGANNENLYCLDRDGKAKWTFRVQGGPVHATPTVAGDYTFVAGCDSALHVINVKDGKEERAVNLNGQVASTGAVADNLLFVGTMTNDVQAIDWKAGRVVWSFAPRRQQQPFQASVALTDKLVLAGCKNKRVYALDRKDGSEVWNFLTEGRIESSPVVAGKRVYAGSLDGKLYVLDMEKGTLVQKIELDGDIIASPVVSGGNLIVGTVKGTIYCLGE